MATNGLPWKQSLAQVEELIFKEEIKRKLLHDQRLTAPPGVPRTDWRSMYQAFMEKRKPNFTGN